MKINTMSERETGDCTLRVKCTSVITMIVQQSYGSFAHTFCFYHANVFVIIDFSQETSSLQVLKMTWLFFFLQFCTDVFSMNNMNLKMHESISPCLSCYGLCQQNHYLLPASILHSFQDTIKAFHCCAAANKLLPYEFMGPWQLNVSIWGAAIKWH